MAINKKDIELILFKAEKRRLKGFKEYGSGSYRTNSMLDEIEEELLDNINYSILQILRINEVRERLKNTIDGIEDINELKKLLIG